MYHLIEILLVAKTNLKIKHITEFGIFDVFAFFRGKREKKMQKMETSIKIDSSDMYYETRYYT